MNSSSPSLSTLDPVSQDSSWMAHALALAHHGLGKTSPNPTVGAVIVKNNTLLAEGWHHSAGSPHAEIEALRALPNIELARGAEIFITLEPCCTHGRTPPCTEALIAAGIQRVVYGATDPNPAHAGRAKAILESAGIAVTAGVLQEKCTALNREWNHWITTGRPWVILKAGMSLDGKITAPHTQWITSEESRQDAMKLRMKVDAILVGGETVRKDNPRLTIRGVLSEKQPFRIIWTRSVNHLPADCHLLNDEYREKTLVHSQATFSELLDALGKRQIVSLLLEGGGKVHGGALASGLLNECVFYVAPQLLGGPVSAIRRPKTNFPFSDTPIHCVTCESIGNDIKITGLFGDSHLRCK